MTPVLIYTDHDRIAAEKDFLNHSVSTFQLIFDALTALEITASLTEINNLVSWTHNGNGGPDFVQKFVIDKILGAGPYSINGIQVTRDAMRGFMVVPDVSMVIEALKNVGSLYSYCTMRTGVRVNHLTLIDGIVAKASTAFDSLIAEFTYYTKSDASTALANSLQTICDALNTHDTNYPDAILSGLGVAGANNAQLETSYKGLSIINNAFAPSLSYIRKFEQTGALNS